MPPKPPDNVVRFRRPKGPGVSWRIPGWVPAWLFQSATGWIIIANIAIYVAMVVQSVGGGLIANFPRGLSFELGAMVPDLVPTQPWRLVCAAFLHAGFFHIAFNMLFLGLVGRRLERALGAGRFVVLYMIAAVGSELVSFGWHSFTGGASVGASGAIMGIVGALTTLCWRAMGRNAPETKMYLQYTVVGVALGIVENLIGMQTLDNAAHVGGWITGALAMNLFVGRRPWNPARNRLAEIACAAGVAACFAATFVFGSRGHGGIDPVVELRTHAQANMLARNFADAEKDYSEAIRLEPDLLLLRLEHAGVLEELNRRDEARAELSVALRCRGSADHFGSLALAFEDLGDLDQARKAASVAHLREPGNPRWKRLYEDLKAKASGSAPATASPAASP